MKGHQGRADELALEIMNLQNEITFCKARQGSGIATLLKVDFKHLRGMFDSLPQERKKEFLRAFIEKILISPERFEIHYTLPSGMELDSLLFEMNGGNGQENGPDGIDENISKSRSGVSEKYPAKSYAGGVHGDAEDASRLSAYGKTGGTARRGVKMTKSD